MIPPIYRDTDGELKEIPIIPPPGCMDPNDQDCVAVNYQTTSHFYQGVAEDPDGQIVRIEYRLNKGSWMTATGTTAWSFTVHGLVVGENLVEIRSVDDAGHCSVVHSCCIVRNKNFKPTLRIDDGCFNPDAPIDSPSACFADVRRKSDGGIIGEPQPIGTSSARPNNYMVRRRHLV
jgi:hypothetical protein